MEGEERAPSSLAFGVLLRRYRLAADLSQEALAERARMSVEGISALERGFRRRPQRETLALLAQALELGPAERVRFEAAVQRDRPLKDDRSSAVRPRHNLPLALTSFHSRESELADLRQLIATHRLVTLTGAGGIGKTRLALEAASELVADFADGVWFVELAPLSEGAFVASAIAQVLGVREVPNQPLLATLLEDLKQQILVLILDNCEHVVEETARIANALLRGCPGVRIVATSRETLRIAGERSFRLPSLAFPTLEAARALRAGETGTYGAISLFVERAQAADHRFALTDESAPIVAEICRRLDGIPLAIELAAARMGILSAHQLRERLDERFRMLTGGSRAVLKRHQTLRALIDWSHDLLDERERALFRRLSVFVNGFTLDGAVAVGSGKGLETPDVFDVLASLVDKSLMQVESDGETLRYGMLESMQGYAREKLEAAGERSASLARHRGYLRDVFAALRVRVDQSGRSAEIDALLIAELENVRATLDGVAGTAEQKVGAELLAAIDNRWIWTGLDSEGVARLERCISQMPAEERRLTSLLWTALARTTNNNMRAREAAGIAVALARDAQDVDALAQALTMYADSLARPSTAMFEEAATALSDAERLAADNVWLRLRILRVRANRAAFMGDLGAATRTYEQLRRTHLELGNASEADHLAIVLADNEHERGETDRAIALVQEVLPAMRSGRNRSVFLYSLQILCGYLVATGRLSEARVVAREVFQSDRHERDETNVPAAIEHLALAIALDDDVRRGAQLAGYSEAALQRLGFQREFYTEQATRTRLEALLAERLAPAELNTLLTQGAALSEEDAIALVLASWPRRDALLARFR
jgi:predicted ATPase/DNA-binding XRE family transcriptional regulator